MHAHTRGGSRQLPLGGGELNGVLYDKWVADSKAADALDAASKAAYKALGFGETDAGVAAWKAILEGPAGTAGRGVSSQP